MVEIATISGCKELARRETNWMDSVSFQTDPRSFPTSSGLTSDMRKSMPKDSVSVASLRRLPSTYSETISNVLYRPGNMSGQTGETYSYLQIKFGHKAIILRRSVIRKSLNDGFMKCYRCICIAVVHDWISSHTVTTSSRSFLVISPSPAQALFLVSALLHAQTCWRLVLSKPTSFI